MYVTDTVVQVVWLFYVSVLLAKLFSATHLHVVVILSWHTKLLFSLQHCRGHSSQYIPVTLQHCPWIDTDSICYICDLSISINHRYIPTVLHCWVIWLKVWKQSRHILKVDLKHSHMMCACRKIVQPWYGQDFHKLWGYHSEVFWDVTLSFG